MDPAKAWKGFGPAGDKHHSARILTSTIKILRAVHNKKGGVALRNEMLEVQNDFKKFQIVPTDLHATARQAFTDGISKLG